MQNPKNLQTLYHMRKSLLALNRARHGALATESFVTAREIKNCIDTISKQIKVLNMENAK